MNHVKKLSEAIAAYRRSNAARGIIISHSCAGKTRFVDRSKIDGLVDGDRVMADNHVWPNIKDWWLDEHLQAQVNESILMNIDRWLGALDAKIMLIALDTSDQPTIDFIQGLQEAGALIGVVCVDDDILDRNIESRIKHGRGQPVDRNLLFAARDDLRALAASLSIDIFERFE